MRTSVDQSKVILHEEFLSPFGEEEFPKYESTDPEFMELLASEEWALPEGVEINREFSRLLALDQMDKEANEKINTYDLSPSEALQVKDRYPEWETGINVKTGERYRVEDVLWECVKDHLTQDNWKPSTATLSLWKVVDEEHKGTIDDPIVYIPPMEIFKDKYYIQNGIKYKCTRNSEQPLTHDLSALVGLYVEKV
nr:MAG TPA: Intradiol ring-cleavage dioxygenase center, intradiol dioxygenase, carbohydrate [Herelleviridae sp.]